MDPEQIYQEVLQEEQQKGSAPPVAEGRAKAARQRAVEGSPHPKEPKWWPGSQPHFEGGDGAAPAPAAEEEVEEVAEEPVAEPVAEAEPAPEPAPAEPVAAAPAAAAAPVATATVEAPAPTQVVEQPPSVRPPGVTHGTPSGNRLRPEDAVSTESQFRGQVAMRERRKLIDELVSTGVPEVAADDVMRPRAPFLAILYVLIPVLAVLVLLAQDDDEPAAEAPPPVENGGGDAGGGLTVVAVDIAFDTDTLNLKAEAENTMTLDNQDSGIDHNISIFPDQEAALAGEGAIFEGEIITGPATIDYTFEGPEAGENYFQCEVHPNMNGAAIFE